MSRACRFFSFFFLLILLICFADSLRVQTRTSNGHHLHQRLERWKRTKDNDKWSSHTGMTNVGLKMHMSWASGNLFFFLLFCYLLTTCNSMKQRWRQHLHLHLSLHRQTGGCLPKVFFFLLLSFFLLYWLLFTISMDWEQQWQGGCFHKQSAEHPTPLDQPIVQYGTLSLESITMKMFSSHNWLYI